MVTGLRHAADDLIATLIAVKFFSWKRESPLFTVESNTNSTDQTVTRSCYISLSCLQDSKRCMASRFQVKNTRTYTHFSVSESKEPSFKEYSVFVLISKRKLLAKALLPETFIYVLLNIQNAKPQPVAKMMRHSHGKTTFLASNRSWSQVCKI